MSEYLDSDGWIYIDFMSIWLSAANVFGIPLLMVILFGIVAVFKGSARELEMRLVAVSVVGMIIYSGTFILSAEKRDLLNSSVATMVQIPTPFVEAYLDRQVCPGVCKVALADVSDLHLMWKTENQAKDVASDINALLAAARSTGLRVDVETVLSGAGFLMNGVSLNMDTLLFEADSLRMSDRRWKDYGERLSVLSDIFSLRIIGLSIGH